MNTYFTDSERTGSSTPLTVHASTIRRHFLSSSWSQICSVLRDPGPAEENGKERPTGFHLDPERSRKERWGVGGLVSVVIPCYNQAHFLGEAIESVLAQSYTNFEVIVVDDGSEDTTSEVASGYEGVRLIRQENGGLSAARNRGLAEASGEYVVFLDSDDRLLVEALEVGVRELESHPECAFVSGTLRHITVDGAPTWVKPSAYVDDHYVALLRRNYVGTPATVMFRKWVFGETGGFDVSLRACEDYDLYLRIARRFPIYHHGELVAEYRRHGATMSADPALMLRSAVAVLRSKREHVRGNEEYEKAYKDGVEFWQDCYGYPLVCEARDHAKGHEWVRVARAIPTLLLYFPQGLTLLSGRGMEEFRLRRELRACTRDLQTHLRRRRDHSRQRRMLGEESGDGEGRLGELGNVMAEERREIRRLRRRSRRLRQRVREIDGRAQNGLTRRILRGLRRVTTKKMARNHGASDYRVGVRLDRQHARSERQGAGGLVSVVIPCYNQAHFLGEAIESVLAQSYTDFELIVVDDGSEDNTPEVASGYEGVRLVRQENRGLAGARNRGLVEASGEYVVFLDSDDRLLAGALEVGVRELEAHPECAFVSGHYRAIGADGSHLWRPYEPPAERDGYLMLLQYSFGMPAVVMYRRWIFGEVGDFDGSVDAAADWDLYLRIARHFPIYHHGEVIAEYRQHGTSMNQNPALMLRSTVAVLRSQRHHLGDDNRREEGYRVGLRGMQADYGVPLAADIRDALRQKAWKRSFVGTLVLARYNPRGLALLLSQRRLDRAKLAREVQIVEHKLDASERRIQSYQRRLRALRKQPRNRPGRRRKLKSYLGRERREARRLKRRKQRLARELGKVSFREGHRPVPPLRGLAKKAWHLRARIAGRLRTRQKTGPAVALLPWGDVYEDFLDGIGVSLDEFCTEMSGGYLFGYIDALKRVGVNTALIIWSRNVSHPERRVHRPTGATVWVLPPSRVHMVARRFTEWLDTGGRWAKRLQRGARLTTGYTATTPRVLARVLDEEGCSALLVQEYEYPRFDICLLLGRFLDLPVLATFQGGRPEKDRSLKGWIRRHTVPRASGLLIGPRREAKAVRRRYGLPRESVSIVGNPIDIEEWKPGDREEARAEIGLPEKAAVACWHGRIDIRRKGLDILVEAWRLVCERRPDADLRLLLCGGGAGNERLRQLIDEAGLRGVSWHDE